MRFSRGIKKETGLLLAILLPCLLIGIYGLRLTFQQKRSLEIEIRENLDAELTRIAKGLDEKLEKEEKEILAEMAAMNPEEPFEAKISALLARHPIFSYPFIMSEGRYLFPGKSGQTPLSEMVIPYPRPAAPYLRFPQAEKMEYEQKDIVGALKSYVEGMASSPPPSLRIYLIEAIGRCYFKLGHYPQAASYYEEMETEARKRWPEEVGLFYLSLRQQALCHKLRQDREGAFSLYLKLYESLINAGPEMSRHFGFFLREAIDYMQSTENFLVAREPEPSARTRLPEISRRDQWQYFSIDIPAPAVESDASDMEKERRRFEKMREIYTPNEEETLFYSNLQRYLEKGLRTQSIDNPRHRIADFAGVPFVVVYATSRKGNEKTVGFCLDIHAARALLFPREIPASPFLGRFYVHVFDSNGARVHPAGSGKTIWLPIETIPFSNRFPGWKLAMESMGQDALAALIEKRLAGNYLLLAGLTVSLLFGLFFFFWANVREKRLFRQKTAFIQAAAHNLKTPLTRIRLLAEKMEFNWMQNQGMKGEYLRAISAETAAMAQSVGRTLDFFKMESGMGHLHFAPLDPAAWIRETLKAFSENLQAQEMELKIDIEEPIPLIQADREALTSALANLVDNAVKYSSKGKLLHIVARTEAAGLVIVVKDQGPGIASEEQNRIFEPFYRVPSPGGTVIPGTGLGLYLVQKAIDSHNGKVTVESRPGNGCTFRITLPVGKT